MVTHGEQRVTGKFVVVENADGQLPLLGRDWLYNLRLDWPKLISYEKKGDPRVHTLHAADWINKYPEVTKSGLGRLKGLKAEVKLKAGAKPQFCRSRPVPVALREKVEEALWKQVEEGELEQVDRSDWAAPIVVVKRKDGEIRICTDIKRTINPHLQEKTFPLPTPDEVFSTLANGESFSKLDLARAYKQMEVEESSQPYLTINTHLGLFRYRRLPFGIASAPAMWQKAMSVVLHVDLEGHQRKVHVDHLLQRSSPSMADQDMQVSTFKGNPASTTQSATTGGTGPEPAPPHQQYLPHLEMCSSHMHRMNPRFMSLWLHTYHSLALNRCQPILNCQCHMLSPSPHKLNLK